MRRAPAPVVLAAALALGCSHLAGTNGPITLQVFPPTPLELEVNDTVQLRARALDEAGDSIGAQIFWRAGDTTVAVDSVTGRLTAHTPSSSGRIQARTGSLVSDVITFTTFPRADTIVIAPTADTTTVLSGDSVSAALVASLQSDSAGGVFNRRLTYAIASPADSSVVLDGGVQALTVGTAVDGTPAAQIHLHKHAPFAAPDSAVVLVSATRPSGTPVPGSGQRFVVYFQP